MDKKTVDAKTTANVSRENSQENKLSDNADKKDLELYIKLHIANHRPG